MKKLFIVAALILPMMAHAACNCDEDFEDDDGEYRPYSYIGIKGGTNHLTDPSVLLGSASGYGLYMGTRYSELFAVEAEYSFLGTFETASGIGHATAVSLSGVHQIEMGWADLIGKLGIAHTHTAIPGASDNLVDVVFGVGLEMELNRDINMRIGYDHYRIKLPGVNANDSFTHIGIAYRY